MKLIIRIICIGAITYFVSPFTGWWLCMLASFVVSFVSPSSGLNAFISGFLGVGLVWIGHSWTLDVENASSFSAKISEIMGLKDPLILVLASGAVGGVAGGFSSITGSIFRYLFVRRRDRSLYS
ncbi:MAG: hypothetical protein OXH57_09500 [Ekhidna sp.]|nr:hypothetical protein [Ekhidna sp.]